MAFIYADREPQSAFQIPYHKQNAVASYLRHYDNYLYLQFILMQSDKMMEKVQASKELGICERKMKHWEHHANYDQAVALAGIEELKRKWKYDGVDRRIESGVCAPSAGIPQNRRR